MESKDNIIKSALDQVILCVLYDLEQSDATTNEAAAKLSKLYDSLKFDDKLDPDVQARISQYIEQTILISNAEFRHIYLQGVKDCVTVMRKLGLIL